MVALKVTSEIYNIDIYIQIYTDIYIQKFNYLLIAKFYLDFDNSHNILEVQLWYIQNKDVNSSHFSHIYILLLIVNNTIS